MAFLKCSQCAKQFNRQSSLTRHLENFHSKDKQIHTCRDCLKAFSRHDLLQRHERLHLGEGLIPCKICTRRFRGDYLNKHVKSCRRKLFIRVKEPNGHAQTLQGAPSTSQHNTTPPLQWQEPELVGVCVLERVENKGDRTAKRRVEQPLRYVSEDLSQHIPEDELVECKLAHGIINAVEQNELATLKSLLSSWQARGLSLQRLDDLSITDDGITLLIRAVRIVNGDTARFLFTQDFDFNRTDEQGRTALHWAPYSKHATRLTQLLIDKGVPIDLVDNDGETALLAAIMHNHPATAHVLLKSGANANCKGTLTAGTIRETPLEQAAMHGNVEILELLLKAGADHSLKGFLTPAEAAIRYGSARCLELLLQAGARAELISSDCWKILDAAKTWSQSSWFFRQAEEKSQLLHKFTTKVSAEQVDQTSPQDMSSQAAHADVEIKRCDMRSPTDLRPFEDNRWRESESISNSKSNGVPGNTVSGASRGSISMGSILRDDGDLLTTDTPETSHSLLSEGALDLSNTEANHMENHVCCDVHLDSMHDLLQHYEEVHATQPAQVNDVTQKEQPDPDNSLRGSDAVSSHIKNDNIVANLRGAIIYNDVEYFKLMSMELDKSGSINDRLYGACLKLACNAGAITIVQHVLLLEAKVKLSEGDLWASLRYACDRGSYEIARLLLEYLAQVEGSRASISSRLYYAVHQGYVSVAKFLIEEGAGVDGESVGSWSPLHLACNRRNVDMARMLLGKGAKITVNGFSALDTVDRGSPQELVYLLLNAKNQGCVDTGESKEKLPKARLNALSWHATGVINDLPTRASLRNYANAPVAS